MTIRNINDRFGEAVEFASVEEMAAELREMGYQSEDGELREGRDYEVVREEQAQ